MFFSGLTLPLLVIKFINMEWVLGDEDGFWCQAFPVLFYGNAAISLFNLMVVTIHRALMIYSPEKCEKYFTRTRSKVYIFLCWTLPFLLLLPSLTGSYNRHGLKCPSRSCTIIHDEDEHSAKYGLLICGAVLPSVVLAITNVIIKRKVTSMRQQMEALGKEGATRMPKGLRDRENRLTNMMLIIYVTFLLTYWPGVLVKLFDKDINHGSVHIFFYILNWSSVLVNPIIYAATQKRYRDAYRYLFDSTFGRVMGDEMSSRGNGTVSMGMRRRYRRGSVLRSSVSEN